MDFFVTGWTVLCYLINVTLGLLTESNPVADLFAIPIISHLCQSPVPEIKLIIFSM